MSPDRSSRTLRFFEAHPFSTGITIFIVIVFLGWIFSLRAQPGAPSLTLHAWGGALPIGDSAPTSAASFTDTGPTPTTDTASLARPLSNAQPIVPTTADAGFDAFLAQLSRTGAPAAGTSSIAAQIQAAFSGVPTLPANFGTAPLSKTRTPEQAALFAYGDAAGTIVKNFEATHLDEQSVLEAQAKDRGDAASAAKLRALAHDLGAIGTQLLAIENVPASAASANTTLAASYHDLGTKLTAVADAGADDTNALTAIRAYNASADAFVDSYVALVDLFGISGVTFSTTDPGNAFTFTATSGLSLQ